MRQWPCLNVLYVWVALVEADGGQVDPCVGVNCDQKLLTPQAVLEDGYGEDGWGAVEGGLKVSQVQPLLEVDVQLCQPLTRPHVDGMNQNALKADLVASYHSASHTGLVIKTKGGGTWGAL